MSSDSSSEPTRTAFASTDPFEARQFMDRAYGGHLRIKGDRESDWRLSADRTEAGDITVGDVRLPADLTFQVDGHDEVVFNTVLDGSVEYLGDDVDERCGVGDVYSGNHPDLHCICRTHELRSHTLTLPRSLLSEVADPGPEPSRRRWRLDAIRPVEGGAERWRRTIGFVDDLLADDDAAGSPLVIGSAARLVAATALSIFPHNMSEEAMSARGPDAHPATLRRAIAFIEANPAADITLADLGRAAFATPRTVQMAFRRHLDTTPTAFLRKVRLDHAHRALERAHPGGEVTVARVALDWGFANPSRFAAYYRAAYGRLPRQTLSE